MKEVAYISPGECLLHDTGLGHPERIERLASINQRLQEGGLLKDLRLVQARMASHEELIAVHSEGHFQRVSAPRPYFPAYVDPDTVMSSESLNAAFMAAGSALTGLEELQSGRARRVFCGVRPPGHHAESDRAMGFCLFNNAAVAAAQARSMGLAERVLILDWDVHHGNGTQEIFLESDQVYYYSLHQWPFYPGTGATSETGRGAGLGFTLNRPLGVGTGDTEYLRLIEKDLDHIATHFKPQLVVISAGFDAHQEDPLGGMRVTDSGYAAMTRLVTAMADSCCEGRILSVLEGGYDLAALARSVEAHLGVLLE